jgi:hypothetical protein
LRFYLPLLFLHSNNFELDLCCGSAPDRDHKHHQERRQNQEAATQ